MAGSGLFNRDKGVFDKVDGEKKPKTQAVGVTPATKLNWNY